MSFDVHRPSSLAQAVALAQKFGDAARFIAGGTDLMIQIGRRKLAPDHVIDLSALRALVGIAETPDGFSIGALTTHKAIERHPPFGRDLVALPQSARVVGGHQVRNVATVGGNIVNASPAADVVAVLLILDAELVLAGTAGERQVWLDDFLLGPGQTDRRPDEVLASIRFARLPAASATAFLKAGRRRAMEISVVCVAARLTLSADGAACETVRLALGAVGPRVLRARAAETFLAGGAVSAERFRDAGRLAAEGSSPISDVRASARYRRQLVEVMVERALSRCARAIRGGAA
jgi:carbon-monoxide dehydrogenase medium subunit